MTTRRQFLKDSAIVSLSPFVPAFLGRSLAADDLKADARVLVVIQLDGGNDGLNTVIPWSDENYGKHRRELRIAEQDILKLDDAIGLHPQMKPAAQLFEDRRLAIVQGVGYPNPNRSHFESMAIWHHARRDERLHDGIGWLGRAADSVRRGNGIADSIYVGSEAIPVALRGRRANSVSLENETDLKLTTDVSSNGSGAAATNDLAAFVSRTTAQSYAAAKRFSESSEAQSGGGDGYPQSKLGQKLRLVAKLLKLGGGTRVYYVSQTGYDTHAAQLFQHSQLLREFSTALTALVDDMAACGFTDRVVVLAFSEFGRRVEENGSAGTDHGVAGPVFLAGAPVAGGLVGAHPSLLDLDAGDLKTSIDFRQIYAAVLDNWLGIRSTGVLGERFEPLELFRS